MTLTQRIEALTSDRDRYTELARTIGLEARVAGYGTPEEEGYLKIADIMTEQLKDLLEQRHALAENKRRIRKAG